MSFTPRKAGDEWGSQRTLGSIDRLERKRYHNDNDGGLRDCE